MSIEGNPGRRFKRKNASGEKARLWRIVWVRCRWVTLVAMLAGIGFGTWLDQHVAQPRHHGITARSWLEELVQPQRERSEPAIEAFLSMGADAVPVLAQALGRRDSPVKQALQWGTTKLGTSRMKLIPAAEYRRSALDVLCRMGPVARGAIPAVLRMLEQGVDRQDAHQIQSVLTAMDADMIATLLPVAEGTNDILVVRVVLGCWNQLLLGAVVEPAVLAAVRSQTIRFLESTDDHVVLAAIGVLGRLGSTGAPAIPDLIKVLSTPGCSTGPLAEGVVLALGRIGSDPDQVVPVLAGCIAGGDAGMRIRALAALERFGSEAGAAVPALEEALADIDPYVRGRAALALGHMGAVAAGALDGLTAALSDQDESVQVSVIRALGAIGPNARPAVPQLHRAWSNKQSGLGGHVLAALARIETEDQE
jgi:hypothetical protein